MGDQLKIAMICHPSYGGSGVVASELGLALAERGHVVHFVSHSLPFRVAGGLRNVFFHEVDVSSYPLFKYPPYSQALAARLVDLSREAHLDILHAHYAIPHAVAAYLCRQILGTSRPAIVTTLHGTDITLVGIDKSFYEITRFGIRQSDAVTAVSRHLADATRERFDREVPIRVIPNFVDLVKFSPERRNGVLRAAHAPGGELLVGHLSNFRPVKRTRDVIRIFHLLQKEVPCRLLMMGDGIDLEPCRYLADELGVSRHVTFLGPVERVDELLPQLDLFLLPSELESFGLAALEAMACGVPVISTRTGGIPEVVEDGVSGLLCDVGEVECMAEIAASLVGDPPRLRAMQVAARKRAAELFPKDRIVGMYEELYGEVLRR